MAMAYLGRVLVANEALSCTFEGEQVMIAKGDTIREGHPLLEVFGMFFSPQRVRFECIAPVKKPPTPRAK